MTTVITLTRIIHEVSAMQMRGGRHELIRLTRFCISENYVMDDILPPSRVNTTKVADNLSPASRFFLE